LKPNGKCSNGSSNLDHRQRRNRLHGGKVFEAGGEMNEKKWTQGEWSIHWPMSDVQERLINTNPERAFICRDVYIGQEMRLIARVEMKRDVNRGHSGWPTVESTDEMLANTNLIVAAPKLYEALELVLNDYRTDGCSDADCAVCAASKAAFNVAIAALAAARGEK
jgi:hypothetical protein